MRFPGLSSQVFWNNNNYQITTASLILKEVSGLAETSEICAYNYTGENWDENSTYTSSRWNGIGSSLSATTFSYPNYTERAFNITSAVQNWKANPIFLDKGIILKNNTSETNISKRKIVYTTEGSTKPYLSVTYQNSSVQTISDGIYYIKNKHSSKYIDITNSETANGTSVIQYTYHGNKNQQFKVKYESDGYYSIRPMHIENQTSTLDLRNSTLADTDGTDVQIWQYNNSYQEQKFMIAPAVGGGWQIGTKSSNGLKVLEVESSSLSDNAVIQIRTYSDSRDNDNWYFEKAFGCAWAFNEKGNGYGTTPPDYYINCYLYALGTTNKPVPPDDGLYMNYNDSVETVASRVQNNVANRGRSIRRLNGPTDHINDNEYRFCMRVGSHLFNGDRTYDYHFWLQTNTGEWCDKAGWYNAATLKGDVNPSEEPWNLSVYNNFYNSDTIYFAISG